ncbi:MAG: quinoprotein dehydrogenase-associated putative ABC transporter substrate-binding protein [Panacagrimonas sp.]
MNWLMRSGILRGITLAVGLVLVAPAAPGAEVKPLRVCADPGNMPLSNNKGEGFQNKIAEVVAAGLGTTLTYDWRVSTERGLFRGTINANTCDLFMDLPSGLEMVLSTVPLYRSSFVLVSREDRGYRIESLDDPLLKKLKIGVYQMSAIREALGQRDVKANTIVQHISYDGDAKPERQPSYQVQRVIDGELDMAAIWGPFAGYYKTQRQAPIVLQPVNLMDDRNPLEFDMGIAVRRGDKAYKARIEAVLVKEKDKIRKVLEDYGVPLVDCDACVVDGTLPSHGPYRQPEPEPVAESAKARGSAVPIATLEEWLVQGSPPDLELSNAVIGDDIGRVRYLVERKANVNTRDQEGYAPLHNAARIGSVEIATYLLDHGAEVNATDRDGWTPLMFAAWRDKADMTQLLINRKARLEAANASGLTPLAIATQHGKTAAAMVLIQAGSDINRAVGTAAFTPLMLAVAKNSTEVVRALLARGADVNARNTAGYTALMVAAAGNLADVAALLISHKADASVQSEDGRTALAIARERDHRAILDLLEQSGGAQGRSSPDQPLHSPA